MKFRMSSNQIRELEKRIKTNGRHRNFTSDIIRMAMSKDLTIRVRAIDILEEVIEIDKKFSELAKRYNDNGGY